MAKDPVVSYRAACHGRSSWQGLSRHQTLRSTYLFRRNGNVCVRACLVAGEYLLLLMEVDVGIISLKRDLPILASLNPRNGLANLLDQYQAGLWRGSGEDERLLTLARRLLAEPDLRKQLGETGRKLLTSQFSAKAAADQIEARCFPNLHSRSA